MPARFRAVLAAALLAVLPLAVSAQAFEPADRPDFRQASLSLDRGDGTVLTFSVELALSPRQHAYGLMHVESMPRDRGMLFVFQTNVRRSFWMKNTLIPLDILFFDDTGLLVTLLRDVPAHSLTPRLSTSGATYVLELNAGTAGSMGIGKNARLQLPVSGSQ